MKKFLLTFFINISFVVFPSVSFQNKNKTMYTDIIINEMRTRLAFEKKVDDILCYQGVDSQGNTIVHDLVISIAQKLNDQKKKKNELRNDINLLNKLSSHFSEFRNKKNNNHKTPFELLFDADNSINIVGSINNFKDLLPTEKVNITEKHCQRVSTKKSNCGVLVSFSESDESKSNDQGLRDTEPSRVKNKTKLNNDMDLFYQQKPVCFKKNMGMLFEYESLQVRN